MSRKLLEETLEAVEAFLKEPLEDENGLRFLLAGMETQAGRVSPYLAQGVAEYYTYNTPWITLRNALRDALEQYDHHPPTVAVPYDIIRDFQQSLEQIFHSSKIIHQFPAITGSLTIQ